MELEYGGRAAVTFNQALLMWTIHGRVHLEWPTMSRCDGVMSGMTGSGVGRHVGNGRSAPGPRGGLGQVRRRRRLSHQTILAVPLSGHSRHRRATDRGARALRLNVFSPRISTALAEAFRCARAESGPSIRPRSDISGSSRSRRSAALALIKACRGSSRAAREGRVFDSDDEVFVDWLLRSRAEIEASRCIRDAAAAAEAAAERAGADDATGADDGRDADVDEK